MIQESCTEIQTFTLIPNQKVPPKGDGFARKIQVFTV